MIKSNFEGPIGRLSEEGWGNPVSVCVGGMWGEGEGEGEGGVCVWGVCVGCVWGEGEGEGGVCGCGVCVGCVWGEGVGGVCGCGVCVGCVWGVCGGRGWEECVGVTRRREAVTKRESREVYHVCVGCVWGVCECVWGDGEGEGGGGGGGGGGRDECVGVTKEKGRSN